MSSFVNFDFQFHDIDVTIRLGVRVTNNYYNVFCIIVFIVLFTYL